jgi:hypothetical protein
VALSKVGANWKVGEAFWKSSLRETTPNFARAAQSEEKTRSMIFTFCDSNWAV